MAEEAKKHILIDARIIGTGTGVYTEGILSELQKLDKVNKYTIVVDPEVNWEPESENFTAYRSKNTYRKDMFFIRGNINLAGELYGMHADIFWGTFQYIPFFYFKRNTLLTVHDLTQVRIKNPKLKAEKREEWRKDKKAVIKDKIRKLPFSIIPRGILMWFLDVFSFKFSVRRAKHIFTPSNYVKKDAMEYFKLPEEKVSVTVNGGVVLDKTEELEPVEKLVGKEFLLYVGTDHGHKNLNILVEVMNELKEKKPKLNLVFAGRKDRNYTTIQNRAKELGLEDRIHVLGFVSGGEKTWLFKNAQLYVFPSLSEGFGIPALEALAYGLPVVASDRTAIPEVCGDAAIYFNPEDKKDIAEKIISTIDNAKLKKELIEKGKKRNELFKWDDSAKVVLSEIKKYV
jgi:glycosyltransferase involved in cell wall biosynthesis